MKRVIIPAALLLASCTAPYEPPAIPGAVVYLPFEGDLENLGEAQIKPKAEYRNANFRRGASGKALFTLGDGSWIEFQADEKIMLYELISISFDFNAADWENPYGPGSASKTIAVVSGRNPQRIQHISFSISKNDTPSFEVYFEDGDNKSHRLTASPDLLAKDWTSARLEIDRFDGRTVLFIGGLVVASVDAIPAAVENGVDAIKFGTWYKKNQAYRGAIDNFVIAELRDV